MKNQTLIISVIILFTAVLIGNMVIAPFIFTILIPTIGRIGKGEITVTSYPSGASIPQFDWGIIENNTETSYPSLINVTNTGDKTATLALSAVNQVNITALTLTWNYTSSPLQPSDSVLLQLNQTVTASEETFYYDTRIDATG